MSQNRQGSEHIVQQMLLLMKIYRFVCWMLLVLGLLLMVTIIGIPRGFATLLLSGVMFWSRKQVQAKIELGMAAHQDLRCI